MYNKQTGEATRREIRPEESVWARYEEFLTNNYATVSEQHKNFLKITPKRFGAYIIELYLCTIDL